MGKAEFKLTVQQHQIVTLTRTDGEEDIMSNNTKDASLPHTPFTPHRGMKRFPPVKRRRDIYELPEDDRSALTTAPVRPAPSARFYKPNLTKALPSEPLTSSFKYPETPSSPQREGALSAIGVVASRADEAVTTRAQDVPIELQQ